jgi:5-methylcytosine-specific restriction endonuclease McrA
VSRKQRRRLAKYSTARVEVLERDGGLCRRCGSQAHDVHHLAGRVGDALLDRDRMVSLCRPCHMHIEEQQRGEAYGEGWLIRRNT